MNKVRNFYNRGDEKGVKKDTNDYVKRSDHDREVNMLKREITSLLNTFDDFKRNIYNEISNIKRNL